jgi:hypothetical protein
MFLKWKTLIYSYMKLRHEQHCNATSTKNGMKVVEQLFKFFVWIWCWNFLNRQNKNLERHLCMPLDLGMGQANSSLELSNLWWWLMEPKIVVPKRVSINHLLLEFLQWATHHKKNICTNKIKFNEWFSFAHLYKLWKVNFLDKGYGIKCGAIGYILVNALRVWEHIRNLMWTHWKLD